MATVDRATANRNRRRCVERRQWKIQTQAHAFVRTLVIVAIVTMNSMIAHGQQPFYTDDADVTPSGGVHIESFDEYDWLQHGQTPHLQQNTFNMRVNVGLGHGLELDLDSPLIAIINDATTTPRRPFGIGDTNFGVKYNFREEAERSVTPALTAVVYVEVPTGDVSTGLGSGLTDIWMYGVIQKTVRRDLTLRVNGGYLFTGNTSTGRVGISTARGHVATASTSVVARATERLKVGVELAGAATNAAAIDRAQLQAMIGANCRVRDGLTIDIGFIVGHFSASPRAGVQIGVSIDRR